MVDKNGPDPMIGRVLDGRYRVGPRIARGGMATVYEATDLRLDRVCALKLMHTGLGDDDDFAARFVREARHAARLSHPNVVGVFDQGDDQGTLFLAMEYIPGHTLRDLIRKEAPMAPRKALALVEPVLSALAAAHRAGMIHRDVKPENVLLADDGRVKVADFGLARAVSAETQHTATGGVLIGTVSYLSPELVVDGRADARSDVYAAGVIIYEMLTGRKPHEGESPIQVAYKHVHEDVPPPSEAVPGIPGVRRCAGRPGHRPRPGPAPGRRRCPAAPGAPGPRGARPRRRRRPRADRGPRPGPARRGHRQHRLRPRRRPDDRADRGRRHRGRGASRRRGPRRPRARGHHRVRRRRRGAAAGRPAGRLRAGRLRAGRPRAGGPRPGAGRPRRRRGPLLLALLLVLAVLGGVAGWYFGEGRYTTTPGVINLSVAQAREKVAAAGLSLEVGGREYSETVAAGSVIGTDPAPGTDILKEGTVVATVSRGPERYEVPVLRGLTREDAEAALAEQNLVLGDVAERFHEEVAKGVVLRSDPRTGTELKRDSAVDLVVSRGPKPIKVPDFTGKPAERAEAELTDRGLEVSITRENSDEVPEGDVISQDPSSGRLFRGDTVELVVSEGPVMVEVPGVRGVGIEEATRRLEEAGFEVETEKSDVYVGLEFVVSSDPPQGTMAPRGSTVTLSLV